MSRILFAWELGENYGHLLALLPLARDLQVRGHEVLMCVRDLSRTARLLGPHEIGYLQAPVWLPTASGLPEARSYADILLRHGYLEVDALAGLTEAWRAVYALFKPDLLVAESAPTALLAAADLGIPRCLVGTGFTIPPHADPLPSFRWWDKGAAASREQTSTRALAAINGVRARYGLASWDCLARLFEAEQTFLCTFAEFDHYPARDDARYRGPLLNLDEGDAPQWPAGDERHRIFAYLYPEDPRFLAVLEALNALSATSLIHAPGLAPAQAHRLQSAKVKFSARPLQMAHIRRDVDLLICHGGFGTVTAALLAGRPVLILPRHLEQQSLAMRLQQQGVALVATSEQRNAPLRKLCRALLEEPRFALAARALADRYAGWSGDALSAEIVDGCEMMLRR